MRKMQHCISDSMTFAKMYFINLRQQFPLLEAYESINRNLIIANEL